MSSCMNMNMNMFDVEAGRSIVDRYVNSELLEYQYGDICSFNYTHFSGCTFNFREYRLRYSQWRVLSHFSCSCPFTFFIKCEGTLH